MNIEGLSPPSCPLSYTFTDHLGTPIAQTAQGTAAITWRAEHEPYGHVYEMRTGERTTQPLRFPGQEVAMTLEGQEENYNIFRWYRSGWGRYTQADPLGLRGGVNLYRYAVASPIRVSDRLGLVAWDCKIMYVSAETPGAGPAGGGIIANCLSKCVNKKRVWALYVSTMGGASASLVPFLPAGISYSTGVTLKDSTAVPSADSLNGPFALTSFGAGIGSANYSCTEYGIGSASGGNCSVSDFMVSLGFDFYAGGGSVVNSNTQCCNE